MKQLPLNLPLNPEATFDNFYFGEQNALVADSIQQFLSNEDFLLYLYAAEGEGLTHLLEAIQHQNSDQAILYLPIKELLDFPAQDIVEGLDTMDCVCIDDIDRVSKNSQWQIALFHLFNRLKDQGKKLISTAHCSPRQLDIELQDLKSRLQWGTVLKIQTLNDEAKSEAMKMRAAHHGLQLSDELARFLLDRTERSNKALFAYLKKLDDQSLIEKRKLTIPFVKQVLGI